MQLGNVCSATQQNAQWSLSAVKEMAETRGETCLEYAKNYLSRRNLRNAKATAIEGDACAGDHSIWLFRTNWMT